jgi:hypothetical protein
MEHEIEVEVFRAGDYGARGAYCEDDLKQIAADYSADVHEAPVTIDHHQEGPALGWVSGLKRVGDVLVARLKGLSAEFLEKLRSGEFKKRSVELYRSIEATGRPYLRAVTFLGAGATVVKGLADPVFSESEELVGIEFDEKIPPAETRQTATQAADAAAGETQPCTEDARGGDFCEAPEESVASAASASEAEPGREGTQAFAETDPAVEEFCATLRTQGRLLPAWEDKGLSRFLGALDDAAAVRFSEAPNAPTLTARGWFREFLEALPPQVPMGEAAPGAGSLPESEPGAFPENWRGVRVDGESVALHGRVCRFRQEHPAATYAEALSAVVTNC